MVASAPERPVLFYEGPYYMFSNFSSFQVYWEEEWWMTAEHAYQAAKFFEKVRIQDVQGARSAHDAKKIAHGYNEFKRTDWDKVKLAFMERIIRAKLMQHPYIQRKLLETGARQLVEDSPKDSFWGRGPDWKGKNHLGKIWMKLRDELRAGTFKATA